MQELLGRMLPALIVSIHKLSTLRVSSIYRSLDRSSPSVCPSVLPPDVCVCVCVTVRRSVSVSVSVEISVPFFLLRFFLSLLALLAPFLVGGLLLVPRRRTRIATAASECLVLQARQIPDVHPTLLVQSQGQRPISIASPKRVGPRWLDSALQMSHSFPIRKARAGPAQAAGSSSHLLEALCTSPGEATRQLLPPLDLFEG